MLDSGSISVRLFFVGTFGGKIEDKDEIPIFYPIGEKESPKLSYVYPIVNPDELKSFRQSKFSSNIAVKSGILKIGSNEIQVLPTFTEGIQFPKAIVWANLTTTDLFQSTLIPMEGMETVFEKPAEPCINYIIELEIGGGFSVKISSYKPVSQTFVFDGVKLNKF